MDSIEGILSAIRAKVPFEPEIGIVCGSGLGGLASTLQDPIVIHYEDLKEQGFPQSTVQGHAGELVFGTLGGKKVICMKGRFHFYEGHAPKKVGIPIYVMAALGIRVLVVTNAAGGLNPTFQVGDVMMIKDQISMCGLAGCHPLVGPNDERFGPRFPAMNGVYSPALQQVAQEAAKAVKFSKPLHKGVYMNVSGPTYETPAEINMLRILGGESVGMSTVFEVMAAAHCGIPVLGLSLITNRCIGPDDNWDPPTHAEVLEATKTVQDEMQGLVSKIVEQLEMDSYKRGQCYEHFKSGK